MKRILFLIIITSTQIAFGESVVCKSTDSSKIKNVRLDRADNEQQWLAGVVEFKGFNKNKKISVKTATRKNYLNYVGYESDEDFKLQLGPYHGAGIYKNVQLSYLYKRNNNDDEKMTSKMECKLSGQMTFKNYCEKSSVNNPELNLLNGSRMQNIDLVLASLACDIDVNIKNSSGCTPILLAADKDCGTGNFDIFSAGAYSGAIILNLLNGGAMTEDRDPVTLETAMHKLVRHQDLKAVSILIESEADINAQDIQGFTPLMRAVETRSYKMVDELVTASGDLKLKNKINQTAIDIANAKGYEELLPYLVEAIPFEISGLANGQCAPMEVQIKSGQAIKLTLKSTTNKMFILSSPKLNLNLMAGANSSDSKRLPPLALGEYSISCGVHGGQLSQGKIKVTE